MQDQDRTTRPRLAPLRRYDPARIGPYGLLGRLGAGAMGQVFLGRSAAGRLVAVKTIREEYAEEPDFRDRFAHEVAAARRVSGVFTAAVVAADPEAEVPWLATAYVPAPSLARLVEVCGPLPVPAVQWLAAGCAEALESIHGAGLVHRDLKPSNVLVSLEGPQVIDFGVARAVERVELTATRDAIGTPAYMAPEQARDTRRANAASDLFSLGSTLLYAATGHAPYQGDTMVDVLVRLATEPPDLSGLPPELADTVAACLDLEPSRRPTPAALVAELAPAMRFDDPDGTHPLPGTGVALIEEYRRRPQPAVTEPGGADPDRTFGSRPSLPSPGSGPPASVSPISVPPGGLPPISLPPGSLPPMSVPPGALTPGSVPPEPLPAGDDAVPAGHDAFPAGRDARSAGHDPPPAGQDAPAARHRPDRRLILLLLLPLLAVGLVAGGVVLGARVAGDPPATVGEQQPGGREPGRGGPPPPVSGADDQPTGTPQLLVNQPRGDPYTTFAVSGRGWEPGTEVTFKLVDGPTLPNRLPVDRHGAFNYVIGQDRDLFPRGLPVGELVVAATAGDRRLEVHFRVDP